MRRRAFLSLSAGAAAALGEMAFLSRLGAVRADETKLDPKMVALHPEIEPLVRFLERTPRERVLEELATKIRKGSLLSRGACGVDACRSAEYSAAAGRI